MAVCGSNFCPEDADSKDIVLDNNHNKSSTINQSETGVGGNFQTDRTKIYLMVSIQVECYSQTNRIKNIFLRKIQERKEETIFRQVSIWDAHSQLQLSLPPFSTLFQKTIVRYSLTVLLRDNNLVFCQASLHLIEGRQRADVWTQTPLRNDQVSCNSTVFGGSKQKK